MFEAAVVEVESAQSCDRCHLGLSRGYLCCFSVRNERAGRNDGYEQGRSDINLMYELLEKMIPPWRVEGSILYKGERALSDDAELVDWLAHLTGTP